MKEPLGEITQSSELAASGWVRIDAARWMGDTIELSLAIDEGRDGRPLAHWAVRCLDVCEHRLCDANGGGLQVSGGDHPVVQQHLDPITSLLFRRSPLEVLLSGGFRPGGQGAELPPRSLRGRPRPGRHDAEPARRRASSMRAAPPCRAHGRVVRGRASLRGGAGSSSFVIAKLK
jgi:hypothetical protein